MERQAKHWKVLVGEALGVDDGSDPCDPRRSKGSGRWFCPQHRVWFRAGPRPSGFPPDTRPGECPVAEFATEVWKKIAGAS